MSVAVSVEFSPVNGGLLRTWGDDGSKLWQMWGGDLEDTVGRGQLARTEVEPHRYREVGLLEELSGDVDPPWLGWHRQEFWWPVPSKVLGDVLSGRASWDMKVELVMAQTLKQGGVDRGRFRR